MAGRLEDEETQSMRCPQYPLRDEVLARLDESLHGVATDIELQVVRYAA
jgi:hypothetical protein